MRPLSLNLLTSSVTLLLLGALTVPAIRVVAASESPAGAAPVPELRRTFGVYVDPWHVDDWARKVGATPQMVAKFQAFARRQPVEPWLNEIERRGIRRVLISWEPWQPVPAARGLDAQRRPQPGYRNADIAAGAQDSYLRRFARSLSGFDGTVYVRYAHEMNGFWYPWSRDAAGFVRAWRHIVRTFRKAGAGNVRFVWSVNPNLYQPRDERLRNMRRYWPGRTYVDFVGSTMINFGRQKEYSVARLHRALTSVRATFRKPVVLTETNTAHRGRVRWLRDLRRMLARSKWIRAVAWSQLPSRGKAQRHSLVGDTNWDVTRDPPAAAALRRIVEDWSE
jgi:mannan endo-1,4-beta-mannosidase